MSTALIFCALTCSVILVLGAVFKLGRSKAPLFNGYHWPKQTHQDIWFNAYATDGAFDSQRTYGWLKNSRQKWFAISEYAFTDNQKPRQRIGQRFVIAQMPLYVVNYDSSNERSLCVHDTRYGHFWAKVFYCQIGFKYIYYAMRHRFIKREFV